MAEATEMRLMGREGSSEETAAQRRQRRHRDPGKMLQRRPRLAAAACVLVVLAGGGVAVAVAADSGDNGGASRPLERNLGTKTPYLPPKDPRVTPPPQGCGAAVSVNVLARHGTRYSGHIVEINALAEKLRSAAGAGAPAWLQNYSYPRDAEFESLLAPSGAREHYELAKRLRRQHAAAFPSASRPYNPVDWEVWHTFKSRTARSASAFSHGATAASKEVLPGGFVPVATQIKGQEGTDSLLRFHKACPAYTSSVKDNPAATKESTAYVEGPEISTAASVVAARAGAQGTRLSGAEFLLAFEACAYDIIVRDTKAEWCSLIDANGVLAANYASDLDHWYELAGGNVINGRMGMLLLRDFFAAFDAAASKGRGSVWRFAHAETTTPFLNILGYFDGMPQLTAAHRDEGRAFRSAVVAPFSANVVASLHLCSSGAPQRVRWTVNEVEVTLPACSGEVYCDLGALKTAFADPLKKWDYHVICNGTCSCQW
eukprot:TRINITY_DN32592_c0_g1_i1.p1 TRINITY_DN32592_c0_g1~~TRINITY_DN32592_c0_g1_i1.p1  ORF type:complete len:487 (+),score=111.46 TRINITY_DN32592_c0_g1_i1:75-1535(+)